MRVLGIVCSPRKGGNTEILMNEALRAVREAGGETELVLFAGKEIAPCDACGACVETGVCKIEDDMQEIYGQLERADGVIIGTPVYFINVSAQAKIVMDRMYALFRHGKMRGKVGGALVALRRVGGGQVLSLMYSFFAAQRMVIAGGGIGYGREKGEVREGTGGSPVFTAIEEARAVGKSVARMIQNLSRGA